MSRGPVRETDIEELMVSEIGIRWGGDEEGGEKVGVEVVEVGTEGGVAKGV